MKHPTLDRHRAPPSSPSCSPAPPPRPPRTRPTRPRAAVTYSRDVAPILQARCQGCHRPGQIGPMPLRSYDEVRPWAKAIAKQVSLREMPPWFAHPDSRPMKGDQNLRQEEIDSHRGVGRERRGRRRSRRSAAAA